jgi:hypothetical protein
MKLEIHFEFRGSLRKFQNLNFWDATHGLALASPTSPRWNKESSQASKESTFWD